MVISFPNINEQDYVLVLKNLDGTPIQTLGYARNIALDLSYNEVSSITFSIPSQVEGVDVPGYSSVVGMKIVDLVGVGQFILINPSETDDGLVKIKNCKGYSLEYEFAKKNIYLEEGTYNFFNGTNTSDKSTIVGRIKEVMPEWTFNIDTALAGVYRTFGDTQKKVYDFIKSDVQQTFGCIFDFNTYTRTVNIVSVSSVVPTKPVYLSHDNLIKEIDTNEDSDGIITCLDVSGADGVDIRSVNPTGTNKIYNLDYFMNTENFSQELITKWRAWEAACEAQRTTYSNQVLLYNMSSMRLLMEQADLTELEGDLSLLQNQQAVIIQSIQQGLQNASALTALNLSISSKANEIAAKKLAIANLETQKMNLLSGLEAINRSLAMDAMSNSSYVYFEPEELAVLRRYFIEDSLDDSSFVVSDVADYNATNVSTDLYGVALTVTDEDEVATISVGQKTLYEFRDGTLVVNDSTNVYSFTMLAAISGRQVSCTITKSNGDVEYFGPKTVLLQQNGETSAGDLIYASAGTTVAVTAPSYTGAKYRWYYKDINEATFNAVPDKISVHIVHLTIEVDASDGTYVLSGQFSNGRVGSVQLDTGNITFAGSFSSVSSVSYDSVVRQLTISSAKSKVYFTSEATDYSQSRVEMELLDYATQVLNTKASPTYTFNVSCANFLRLDDFVTFKNNLTLGQRIYLKIDDNVLEPYVVGVHIEFDDPTAFSITFSNSYTAFDSSFALSKLLDQSVSMGKTLSQKSGQYAAFVNSGASSEVHRFMQSALDIAKNAVMSSGRQAITYDDTGIRIRKWQTDATGNFIFDNTGNRTYDPEELWITDNVIAFTDDSWATAKMAIGKVVDPNLITYKKTTDTAQVSGKTYYTDASGTAWNGTPAWSTNLYEIDHSGTAYGIVAPYLVGTMLIGENLIVDTGNGSFRVDQSGVYIDSTQFYIHNGPSSSTSSLANELASISTTYSQSTVPSTPHSGDLWFVSGNSDIIVGGNTYYAGKFYRYNGSSWVLIEDAGLSALQTMIGGVSSTVNSFLTDNNSRLDSTKLSALLASATQTTYDGMTYGTGNIMFDNTGMWLINTKNKNDATHAVWMNDRGIIFGSRATSSASWSWSTAIDYTGIAAEALIGKTITGITLSGSELSIGGTALNPAFHVTTSGLLRIGGTDANPNFEVDQYGNLIANSGYFSGTIDASNLTGLLDSSDGILDSPTIIGSHIYAANSYNSQTGVVSGNYAEMDSGGFNIYATESGSSVSKVGIGYTVFSGTVYPYMSLGQGAGANSGSGSGTIYKLAYGIWVGDDSVLAAGGGYPGGGTGSSPSDISTAYPNATGVFIDLSHDKIYKYISGVPGEIGGGVAVFG